MAGDIITEQIVMGEIVTGGLVALGLSIGMAIAVLLAADRRASVGLRGSGKAADPPDVHASTLALGSGGLLVVGLALWLRSPTVGLLGPWLGWWGWRQRQLMNERADRRRLQSEVIEAVDATIMQLRSGQPLAVAFQRSLDDEAVAHVASSLRPSLSRAKGGAPLAVALDEVADDAGSSCLRLVAATVATLSLNGGAAVASLERLNDTLRARRAAMHESRAQASQATASAAVMGSLPVVFGSVVAIIEPALANFYLRHPIGVVCVLVSAALTSVGWLWMERVIEAER